MEKPGIEFAIHKIGQTNSINVVLLCKIAIWSLLVLESPVLDVHNVHGGIFLSQVSSEDCHKHQLG